MGTVLPRRAASSLGSVTVTSSSPAAAKSVGWSMPRVTSAMPVIAEKVPMNASSLSDAASTSTTPVSSPIAIAPRLSTVTPGTSPASIFAFSSSTAVFEM
jgi:hypothetical protein